MIKKITLFILIIAAVSCKNDDITKPKVSYENTAKPKAAKQADTAKIVIADLPINFSGTTVLLFPVGEVIPSKRGDQSFSMSNNNDFQITGYLTNLHFQKMNSDSIVSLTDKAVLIETATYLKSISDKYKKQLMVYTLADADTNLDQKLDENDIQSLYISTINGENFTKISQDLTELVDWNIIENNGKMYYRTIEDTNKNGLFDKNDKMLYFYLNLLDKNWKSKPYFPLK